jgi:hypothetical protein
MLIGLILYFGLAYTVACIIVVAPLFVWSRRRGVIWRASEAMALVLPCAAWALLALSSSRSKGIANGYELLGLPLFLGVGIVVRTMIFPDSPPWLVILGQAAAVLFAVILFLVVPAVLGV